MSDYYTQLGVSENASQDDIKEAWRNKVKSHHPDASEDGSVEKFKKIKEAYEVLSDREERRKYDTLGHSEYIQTKSSAVSEGSESATEYEGTKESQSSSNDASQTNTRRNAESRSNWDDEDVTPAPPVWPEGIGMLQKILGYFLVTAVPILGWIFLLIQVPTILLTFSQWISILILLAGVCFVGIGTAFSIILAESVMQTERRLDEVFSSR